MAVLQTGQTELQQVERSRALAAALQQMALQPRPIQSHWQGLAKLAQILAAQRVNRMADERQQGVEDDQRKAVAAALAPKTVYDQPEQINMAGRIDPSRLAEINQQIGDPSVIQMDQGAMQMRQDAINAARGPGNTVFLEDVNDPGRQVPKTADEMAQGLAKVDPNLAVSMMGNVTLQQMLADRGLIPGLANQGTTNMKEYQYAKVNDGFEGTFQDWIQLTSENGSLKPPQGYRWINGGMDLDYIKGGPADPALSQNTPEASAKIQMLDNARYAYKQMMPLLFEHDANGQMVLDENGVPNVNYKNVVNSKLGTPWTQGRMLAMLNKEAIEAKLRAETGAAAPQPEVTRLNERFRVDVSDNAETAQMKMTLLRRFLDGAYDRANKDGRFSIGDTIDAVVSDLDEIDGMSQGHAQQSAAPQAALDYLKAHPETIDMFEQMFGYRPPGYR